jgi:hypothetical protein
MGTERDSRPRAQRSDAAPPIRQRIPLPPLPSFRRGRTATGSGGVTGEEADLLSDSRLDRAGYALPSGPGHEGHPLPLQDRADRTGALGATILNDLVDEIEKDLEAEIERHADAWALPPYRRVVGCSYSPAAPSDVPDTDAENRPMMEVEE